MADKAGQTLPDLRNDVARSAELIDFFELLRQLENTDRIFGQGGHPQREPARLGLHIRLVFAVQDVARLEH
ncbi:type VI secretion system baseplate subunit TssG, partial [Rhizobium ruizarguesonis]